MNKTWAEQRKNRSTAEEWWFWRSPAWCSLLPSSATPFGALNWWSPVLLTPSTLLRSQTSRDSCSSFPTSSSSPSLLVNHQIMVFETDLKLILTVQNDYQSALMEFSLIPSRLFIFIMFKWNGLPRFQNGYLCLTGIYIHLKDTFFYLVSVSGGQILILAQQPQTPSFYNEFEDLDGLSTVDIFKIIFVIKLHIL